MNTLNHLAQLVLVSKVDASIALIRADRKKLQDELAAKSSALKLKQEELRTNQGVLDAKSKAYHTEEKRLKGEQLKLVDRRKALATLSNYKLQQSAQTEIELASKQLLEKEDGLIALIVGVEELEKRVAVIEGEAQKIAAELAELEKSSVESFTAMETREQEKNAEREQLAAAVDKEMLRGYDRIRTKYPMDALSALKQGSCAGCFIHLGPQTEVQIMRGTALVKCRGCGRILYLETPSAHNELQ